MECYLSPVTIDDLDADRMTRYGQWHIGTICHCTYRGMRYRNRRERYTTR